MKLNTPIKFTLFLSLILFIHIIIFVAISTLINIYISAIILFVILMVSIFYILQYQFYEKIKIIYKNIYKFKGTSSIHELNLESADKEAENWANLKEEELLILQKNENYRREFIGNVSHELKTPIFNIQGYVQTLIDGGIKDENVNMKYLKRANISVDRMINIVEDLEVISRLETDNNELDFENFNIIHLIEEVLDQLEMKANKMNIALLLKSESNSDIVYADKNKMQQVFMNLISNSIKYGKDGGTTNVRLFDMSDKLLIEVADDGIGISENALSRLFERFYRVDKNRSREIGGTGLGLAIVKHIIEGHQQTINVRSTVNIGSTFSFILEKENNN
jgi:two-component system phosphate regulon sensor histidine kinase PhoR|tara:strand:+ start:2133 stop:3140 length:1008 start_codon:yes stop_codon:yes gene_type:complete